MPLPNQRAKVTTFMASPDYKVYENVFFYELTGTFPSNYDINAAALAVEGHFTTQLQNVLSSDTTYLGLTINVNNLGVTATGETIHQAPGSGSSGIVPNELAAVVRWQTNTGGRSGHGRSFLTGFQNDWVSGGRLTTAGNAVIALFATAMVSSFTNQAITWNRRLYSRTLDQMLPISSYVVEDLVGTQRKRRPIR